MTWMESLQPQYEVIDVFVGFACLSRRAHHWHTWPPRTWTLQQLEPQQLLWKAARAGTTWPKARCPSGECLGSSTSHLMAHTRTVSTSGFSLISEALLFCLQAAAGADDSHGEFTFFITQYITNYFKSIVWIYKGGSRKMLVKLRDVDLLHKLVFFFIIYSIANGKPPNIYMFWD